MNAINPTKIEYGKNEYAKDVSRVRRGGSWFAIGENAWAEESSPHDPSNRDRFLTLGFRLVRNK
jgi:formylglycine-generating enzyme required for sulfatase activity